MVKHEMTFRDKKGLGFSKARKLPDMSYCVCVGIIPGLGITRLSARTFSPRSLIPLSPHRLYPILSRR